MSLQLHRPDGKGGLEPRAVTDENWHNQLRSPRWGASLKGGKLPRLANPEMNPTSTARSVAFWLALGRHHVRDHRRRLRQQLLRVSADAHRRAGRDRGARHRRPGRVAAPASEPGPAGTAREPDRRRHRPGATMQRALIASGVLGLGTALVFGAAAVTASLFPNGSTVAAGSTGGDVMFAKPASAMAVPMPPQPMFAQPGVVVGGGVAPDVAPAPTTEPGPTD